MKINRLISLGKVLAILIIVLGIIHDVATFSPLIKGGLGCLSPTDSKAMIYMSLVCGTSFILSGVLLIILLKKVEHFEFLTSTILLISVYLALCGVLSVVYMFDNPFAWVALLLILSMFFMAVVLKSKLEKKSLPQR